MFYNENIEEIEKKLKTSSNGLSNLEVKKRIEKYGKNILPKKKQDGILKIFINEFKDPIVLLLIFAIVVSFIASETLDAIAIIFIVLVDAIMGTYQENKANNTAEALSNLVKVKSKVIRDGKIINIDSENLTIGDYIILESGDKIPADARIVESHNFNVNESILTGESLQVHKNNEIVNKDKITINDKTNIVFSGTTVVTGRAKAIVIAVGLDTEIGKIATTIHNTKEEKSPLTVRVQKFSKQISFLVIIIAIIITILLLIKGVPYHEIFLSVVALAVSAMPEGLPLALTMALTIGSNKMAKKNVIVRKLNSVESLGSCTVIASDKTGTLTVNEQTAKKILLPNKLEYNVTGTGYDKEGKVEGENIELAKDLSYLGVINNEAIVNENKMLGDSIDIAFKILGQKLNVDTNDTKILEVIPYESENKYSCVFYEQAGSTYCTVKGSLEKVKEFCNKVNLIDNNDFNILDEQNDKLAEDGYRVIALAKGKVEKKDKYIEQDIKNLTFMGMVGFIDPIRKEVVASIKECKEAGIKVLMITGDHPLTAYSIAKSLGLTTSELEVTTGEEVDLYLSKGKEKFDNFVKSKTVFTRVTPIQKLEIVESLKRMGEFVAVTGDGVNDAPALKSANIGIAMGSGTDIARETANMIVMDDNFKSIVNGVKEGRVAYANIRKIIYFLVSCGLAEVLFFILSIMFDLPLPLVAIQLLWLNVVTDGIQDFALSFEKAENNIMKQPPRSPKEPLFDRSLFKEIIFSGSIIGVIIFITWYYLIKGLNIDINVARGYIMCLMVFIQNIHVFNCRSEKESTFKISLKSNYLIVFGVLCSILLQIIVMEVPFMASFLKTTSIPLIHLIFLVLTSSIVLIVMEIYKKISFKE